MFSIYSLHKNICPYCPEHESYDGLIAKALELCTEMLPLLEKTSVAVPGEKEAPVLKMLFIWLLNPNRTMKVLKKAGGLLWHKEFNTVGDCLAGLSMKCASYICLVASEALAIRFPILEGHWEYVTWLIVKFRKDFRCWTNSYKSISDRLNKWIIFMMVDSEFCPNPYLRLEFLDMFSDLALVNSFNEPQAFDAVMLAFSPLKSDLIKEFFCDKNNNAGLRSIYLSFMKFSPEYKKTYDHKLSDKLLSEASFMLHDVTCSHGFNPNRNITSSEVTTITALFQTISMNVLNTFKNVQHSFDKAYRIFHTICEIVTAFRKSCETPQLIDATATCVMDVVELVVEYELSVLEHTGVMNSSLLFMSEKMLQAFCDGNADGNLSATPVGQALNHKYQERLSNLRMNIIKEKLNIDAYPIMCSLMYRGLKRGQSLVLPQASFSI